MDAFDPRDTEDLAVDPDGLLYVADIGDNNAVRDSVTVGIVDPAAPATAQICLSCSARRITR